MDDTLAEIMTKLRSKWCDDLEDMLQCPICMLCPTNMFIYQCVEGHHICHDCKSQLHLCPTCNKNWTAYRNRLAENMCSKFDDIKSSLIDPEAKINELLIPDKFCVGTQTDNVEVFTVGAADTVVANVDIADSVAVNAVAANVVAPKTAVAAVLANEPPTPVADVPSGTYPCCIGDCKANMSFDALIEHIKDLHPLKFIELPLGNELMIKHNWFFAYEKDVAYERVIRISHVGTFVVKLVSDVSGNLTGYVMMIHCGGVAKQFSYELTIGYDGDSACSTYTDNVYSSRAPAGTFNDKGLRVPFTDLIATYKGGNPLKCTMCLARKLDDTQTLKINAAKKKRSKNRNNNIKGLVVF